MSAPYPQKGPGSYDGRVAGGSADRNLGRTWSALRPAAEWSARQWNRQPAGFAIGGVAPVGQAPTIVLIGSGERLTGVLAAGRKLPRMTRSKYGRGQFANSLVRSRRAWLDASIQH
jgi:hypothetical protein